ncbi:MAG: hypothetical protein JXJ22_15360 [Bacteroidales bacterium]|nr:hypothetical protein [Bacteroidales bacterium]
MAKKYRFLIAIIAGMAIIGGAVLFIIRTKSQVPEIIKIDPGFKEYVSAFTSGSISSKSYIRMKLTSQYKQDIEPGKKIDTKLFDFTPAIKGKSYWVDDQTIEFRPDKALKSGTSYVGQFYLEKILDVPEKFSVFPLQFQVIRQSIKVSAGSLKPYNSVNLKKYLLEGTLMTSDFLENDVVEKIISVNQDGKALTLIWKHDTENKTHSFQADSIVRKDDDDVILMSWDGNPFDIESKGSEKIEVPGLSNFKLIDIRVFHQPNQYVLLTFSDPLDSKQNLAGLISVQKERNLKFSIEGNQVKAFLPVRITGERKINVDKAIKNVLGYKMKKNESKEITFEATKPEIRLIGKGVVLPNSNGLLFPFESVNLSAVNVKVIKIYEDNIAQFLQVNELDGEYQLKRVGRLILNKRINLVADNIIDYGRWNAFSIDLAELIKAEPGAIYRIELGFNKKYSLYPCNSDDDDEEILEENWDEYSEEEQSYWDGVEDYYGGYYDYDWQERDNPCNKSYYRNKSVNRNVLASDLGLIAKLGKNNKVTVAVSEITSTKPMNGVDLEVLNYQQQVIGTGQTNTEGLAEINIEGNPFLLVAKKGKNRGYLKLIDGSSLSLSRFDVSGAEVQKGLKGFLYGERGVWRPGDSLFLTFILEDKDNLLPGNHPVTFELLNPDGKIVKRIVKAAGLNNFYSFITVTDPEAPTGNWIGKVRVGGAVFTRNIKIETIKPNRLKINIDFGTKKLKANNQGVSGKLSVKWLHGAIAKNLKARVDVTLHSIPTRFEKYNDYIFDDPSVEYMPDEINVFDSRIDENGDARIAANLNVNEQVPGMLNATFLTRVFEEGGDFSIDQFAIPYAPYNTFVGVKTPKGDKARGMLLTDEKHKIEVVTVNADGEPVSVRNLDASVYKVEWRWWWQSGSDNLASYIGRDHITPIIDKKISTTDGFGSFDFEIKYPDWGRYLIKVSDANGHSTGKIVYVDWPGWAGRAQRENPEGASMLMFNADKENYKVGESATVTFPSSENGRALVSLETGSKVLDNFWVQTTKDQTVFSFKITELMAPNVYVNITLLQPHAQTANDLPIRLYGVIPLLVSDPKTRLEPVIEMNDELKPESAVNILVKEKTGRPMTFTLALVDEGLLDLTRFKTPDPWSSFYAREALSVKTWDIFDYILGAYGAKIEQVFAIGGDDEIMAKPNQKAERFKPVIKFFGPYALGRNEKKSISFTMPRYVGSVRTMVISGNNGAYGFAEKATPVKNPLIMLATLPRVLSPGEKVKLPVTVFAMNDKVKDVTINVKSNNLLQVSGSNTKKIRFDKQGDQDVTFDLEVAGNLGIGKVELLATSGSETASYEVELDVRAPNPEKTKTFTAVLKPGEKWNQHFDIFGIRGTNAANLEVSGMPPLNLDSRMRFLIHYPYGCVEQTTSSVFPQLYIGEVTELDKNSQNRIKNNIEAGINRLKSFQLSNGGFGYWPGASEANDWGTNYAGHFLLEAERLGYSLPSGLKDNWLNYQQDKANNWTGYDSKYRNDFIQAYRLYTLALANKPDLSAMNRLKENDRISLQTKYYLASAYAISGNKEAANDLIANLDRNVKDYKELSYTYGSADRDRAIMLETLLILNKFDEAMPLIKELSEKLNSRAWMSTQTTAYCLRAMAKSASIFKKSVKEFEYTYSLDQEKAMKVLSTKIINQHPLELPKKDSSRITIQNKSQVPFYISLTVAGTPLEDNTEIVEKNLMLSVVYRDMEDQVIDVKKIEQGTDFKVEISVTHPGLYDDYKELALSSMFPSGWEIHNTRLFGGGEVYQKDVPEYQDIRDDRVNTFFDLKKFKTKTFVILLNASYLGEFKLPAIQCEAMYDNDIQARIPGKSVKVVRAGE